MPVLPIPVSVFLCKAFFHVLHTTVRTVDPKYYPMEVVDFFCRRHSREHIADGIAIGNMGVLTDGNIIVATGCPSANHITGPYVLPDCQGEGLRLLHYRKKIKTRPTVLYTSYIIRYNK